MAPATLVPINRRLKLPALPSPRSLRTRNQLLLARLVPVTTISVAKRLRCPRGAHREFNTPAEKPSRLDDHSSHLMKGLALRVASSLPQAPLQRTITTTLDILQAYSTPPWPAPIHQRLASSIYAHTIRDSLYRITRCSILDHRQNVGGGKREQHRRCEPLAIH